MQDHGERHIVGKYHDLPFFGQLDDSPGNRLALHMVEGRNGIIEDQGRLACVEVRLSEETSETERRLLSFGEDIYELRSRASVQKICLVELSTFPRLSSLKCDMLHIKYICLASEMLARLISYVGTDQLSHLFSDYTGIGLGKLLIEPRDPLEPGSLLLDEITPIAHSDLVTQTKL